MKTLFPAVAAAATALHTDADFAGQLTPAQTKIPPLPRTDAATGGGYGRLQQVSCT
jgi:hypothetical protein